MELSDRLEGLHGGKGPVCIFLELFVVNTVSLHATFPFEHRRFLHLFVVELKQEWPNEFAVDETLEAFVAANIEQLAQTGLISLLSLGKVTGTFSKSTSKFSSYDMPAIVLNFN